MTAKLKAPVASRDHRQGPDQAPVTLVEYGDYESRPCGSASPVVKELQRRLGPRLRFVFRNFPIVEQHPHARLAAEAAEAAAVQRRFWEMHDRLFANQGDLSEAALLRQAAALDLDVEMFAADVKERVFARRVDEDLRTGAFSGVRGTPTFYINGTRYEGPCDADSLMRALVSALPEAERTAR